MCFTMFYGKEKSAKGHRQDAAPTGMGERKSAHESPATAMKSPMSESAATKAEETRAETTPA